MRLDRLSFKNVISLACKLCADDTSVRLFKVLVLVPKVLEARTAEEMEMLKTRRGCFHLQLELQQGAFMAVLMNLGQDFGNHDFCNALAFENHGQKGIAELKQDTVVAKSAFRLVVSMMGSGV